MLTYHPFQPEFQDSDYCKCGLHRLAPDHSQARTGAPEAAARVMPKDEAVAYLLGRIEGLLSTIGSFAQCRGCLKPIYWFTIGTGMAKRRIAFDPDGQNHFGTCANQDEFTKKERGSNG